MSCPKCHSEHIEQTGKFDLTVVDADECRHDFECLDCGTLFQIVYHPARTIIVNNSEACPGCGCMPGDDITDTCDHPDGCGYYREYLREEAAWQASQARGVSQDGKTKILVNLD
jgi:hypothetical protein